MKRFHLLFVLVLIFSSNAFAGQLAADQICVGPKKCIGSIWPMSSVERAYGVKGKSKESEEGVRELCLRRDAVYIRLQYDLRSTSGLKRPAALDVASDAPPEKCEAIDVKGPAFSLSPIKLGETEARLKKEFGEPDEIWQPATSDHGILIGETGLVYGGAESNFVLIVLQKGVVVRVAASVLP